MQSKLFPGKYLSTFDGVATGTETPAPVAAPVAAPAVAPTVQPVIIDISALQANRAQAQQAVNSARAAAPQEQPVTAESLEDLRKVIQKQNQLLQQMQLDNYRVQAVANAQAAGQPLIDSLVGGRTTQEIDASIAFAAAEYELMRQRILAQHVAAQPPTVAAPAQQPAPVQVAPPEPVPQIPQGIVANVAAPMAVTAPQEQPPSLPSVVGVPGIPAATSQVTPEQLQILTSPDAIRDGTYQRNRHLIMQSLRGSMQAPPREWTLNSQGQPLAPPLPAHLAPAPAMQHQNIYQGVTMPIARPAGPMPTPQVQPGLPSATNPVFQGAPQPAHLAAAGFQGGSLDVAAVTAAAQQAVQAARARAS